jgi:general stress protein 26
MTGSADATKVWDLMEKIEIAMLVTSDGNQLRSRPMSAYVARDANQIYFLADARQHKDDEIARNPSINLAFSEGKKYVSVSGRAEVSNDRGKIKQLFTTTAKAWWDNADDPNIRVLKVTPDAAEYWDTPGTAVSYVKMAAAAATGSRPAIGDHQKVPM